MSNFICVVCGNPFTGNKYMKKDAKVVCCSKECKRERKRYTDQLRHFSRTHPNVTKSDIEAEYTKFLLEKLLIKKMKGHAKYLKLLKTHPDFKKEQSIYQKERYHEANPLAKFRYSKHNPNPNKCRDKEEKIVVHKLRCKVFHNTDRYEVGQIV